MTLGPPGGQVRTETEPGPPEHGVKLTAPFARTVGMEGGTGDRIFLELAEVGKAEFLVTGDRGLLGMSPFGHCRIVSPADFRAALEGTAEGC